jgi:hypothetical protein
VVVSNTYGWETSSIAVLTVVVPNTPPFVNLASPTNGTMFTAPATVALSALAGDANGTVVRVEFYSGAMLIRAVTNTEPGNFNAQLNWTNVLVGNYALTARAVDDGGLTVTSAPVNFTVQTALPTVVLGSPTNNATFVSPLTLLLSADALDADKSIGRVDFYSQPSTNNPQPVLLGSVSNAPYLLTWSNVSVGPHTLVAVAVDSYGPIVTSAPVNITVQTSLPQVALLSPTNGSTFTLPANIPVNAIASDADNSIARVELYSQASTNNSQPILLSAITNPPYSFTWNNVASGSYTLTANVVDRYGPVVTSTPVSITVSVPPSTNAPPYVTITNPCDGAMFVFPASVPIEVTATSAVSTITSVGFYAGTNLLGTQTNTPFNFTWTNAPVGAYILTALAVDNSGRSATSAPVGITVTLPPPGLPVFTLFTNAYSVLENAGPVAVTVFKSSNSLAGAVNYATADGSAVAFNGSVGNYYPVSGFLSFTSGELSKTVTVQVVNVPVYLGNRVFNFALSSTGDGSSVGTPGNATITIVEADSPGTTNSFLQHLNPGDAPPHNGQLSLALEPDYAGGQWRLVWETAWRNGRDIISGLPSGNYPVEFKPVAGFLQPSITTNPVTAGALTLVTNIYGVTASPQFGSLKVNIQPPPVAGALDVNSRGQWHLQGDTCWRDSGFTYSNLVAGSQIVEFKTISGWVRPTSRVVLVGANQGNSISATYLVAPASGATPPSVLQFSDATTPAFGLPYVYSGQLLTEAGYGSGCVVKRRVVLTAAHVLFNDANLAYVLTAQWFFQRYAGTYEPPAQAPRGWYVFDGYAAARTNDNSPGVSSPLSQNLDVAALYFLADAGRGGASGYLVSEPGVTEWLQASALKTLVGYPVETVGDINRGKLHATAPGNLSFTLVTNRVFSTAAISGYPGMSGGPLCVQYTNGTYFPAAVFLGGADQTIVRAIDGAVADLINRADVTGNTGDNNTGGGVLMIQVGTGGNGLLAYVQVNISPQAAVLAGAAWRLQGTTDWSTSPTYTAALAAGGSATLEFKPIPGWSLPTNSSAQVALGQLTTVEASYAPGLPMLTFNPASGLGIAGPSGATFRLEYRTSLVSGQWLPLKTNALDPGFNLLLPWPLTNGPAAFYRAVWLP